MESRHFFSYFDHFEFIKNSPGENARLRRLHFGRLPDGKGFPEFLFVAERQKCPGAFLVSDDRFGFDLLWFDFHGLDGVVGDFHFQADDPVVVEDELGVGDQRSSG